MDELNRDVLKSKGWALGKCFTTDSAPLLIDRIDESHRGDGWVHIAATQDCSIINPHLDVEPVLEYFAAIPVDKANGMFTCARNIRRLHIEIEISGDVKCFEIYMKNRGFISREGMNECEPNNSIKLSNENKNIFKRWLANRYIAQTFPDKFNVLTNSLVNKSKAPLIKLFNQDIGKACNSMFISLTPDDRDITEEESYQVTLLLLFSDEKAKEIGYEAMDSFAEKIKIVLENVDGLDPVLVHSLAESDVTYAQIVKMVRWQFDYVSLNDGVEVLSVQHI